MIGLALGVVAAFVFGLFIIVRFNPEISASVHVQVIGIAVCFSLIAAVLGFVVLNLRGLELLSTAVLWALILPAAMLGNWVRGRIRPKTRL